MANRYIVINLFWKFFERCGSQFISIIVSIVLARILGPQDYGLLSLVTVIIAILTVFIESGVGCALIQKKEVDNLDLSSALYFNCVLSVILYFAIYVTAPVFSRYYNETSLIPIIRVMGLIIFVLGIKNVQCAIISRNVLFKKFFFATICGTLSGGILAIVMAYKGFGVWALVFQYLFNQTVDTVLLCVSTKWFPSREFSFNRIKRMFSFAWKILFCNLISVLNEKIRQLVIGRKYSAEDLAYYNIAQQYPYAIISNINLSFEAVLFPVASTYQNEPDSIKNISRKSIQLCTYIISPMMIGLCVISEPLILVLLTDKWLPCVFYLRVACFCYLFTPIITTNLNAIKSLGRSDIYLYIQMARTSVSFIVLFATMYYGVKAIALGMLFSQMISFYISSYPNKKLIKYSFFAQVKDLLPNVILSAIICVPLLLIGYTGFSSIIVLILQIILGGILFVVCSHLFKNSSYSYIRTFVLSFLHK